MRTIVDIPKEDIAILDAIAKRKGISRAELFRLIVDKEKAAEMKLRDMAFEQLVQLHQENADNFEGLDGVAWQKKMRSEWDDREGRIESANIELLEKALTKTPYPEMADHPQSPYKDDKK